MLESNALDIRVTSSPHPRHKQFIARLNKYKFCILHYIWIWGGQQITTRNILLKNYSRFIWTRLVWHSVFYFSNHCRSWFLNNPRSGLELTVATCPGQHTSSRPSILCLHPVYPNHANKAPDGIKALPSDWLDGRSPSAIRLAAW